MARIAIVKVRSSHDIEWQLPPAAARAMGMLGLHHFRDRLTATAGQPFMPQLTLPYLAALGQQYNEAHGTDHSFELFDDHLERIDLRGFEMAWFTALSPTAQATYRLADRARRQGLTTVIGGIHATMCPEEAAPHADALALGEGEVTIPELLADWDASGGRLRPRYQGGVKTALDGLPTPRWGDARMADYCPWIVPVQTSRGCRNACRFCSTTRYQGGHRRHRPAAEIADEIRMLQDQGVLTESKVVFFTDNNIVSDSDHRRGVKDTSYARELFRAVEPLGIHWIGQGEINVAEDLVLTRQMARSGCIMLLIGFETIQQDNLRAVGKPSNQVETYIERIETLHQHAISIIGAFIFGLDHDGPGVFAKSLDFIDRHIDTPQISMLTPFPGTALYRTIKREGRLLHEDWSKYDITHAVYEPRGMSARELEEGYTWLVERVYAYPNMIRRALRYASRRTVHMHRDLPFASRFSSVMAPNMVYRGLSHIGREDRVAPAMEWRPWRWELPRLLPSQLPDLRRLRTLAALP